MTALPTTANRRSFRRPVDAKVPPSDMKVFDAHVTLKKTTPENLLTEIVHQWANHPGRSPSTILLPVENCVLYQGESLIQYTSRVTLAVINSVRASNQGNMSATARRLGYDRTALHRLFRRLKAGVKNVSQVLGSNQLSDRLASLESVKREHIFRVLKSVKGHRRQAARILGLPDSELATILLAYSNAEVTSTLTSEIPVSPETAIQHVCPDGGVCNVCNPRP